jgi:hypothetical protein
VLPHIAGIGTRAKAAVQAKKALLTISFDIVEHISQLVNASNTAFLEKVTSILPRFLDEKPRPRGKPHPVEGHMQIERSWGQAPPIKHGAVLRPGVSILTISREAELDVVARKLANHVCQVCDEVVLVIIVIIPGTVPLLAVGIDVGNDPPLVLFQERGPVRQ